MILFTLPPGFNGTRAQNSILIEIFVMNNERTAFWQTRDCAKHEDPNIECEKSAVQSPIQEVIGSR